MKRKKMKSFRSTRHLGAVLAAAVLAALSMTGCGRETGLSGPLTPSSAEQRFYLGQLEELFDTKMETVRSEEKTGTLRYPVVDKSKRTGPNKHYMNFVIGGQPLTVRLDDLSTTWKGDTAELTYTEIWKAEGRSGWTSETYWKDGKFRLVIFFERESDVENPRWFVFGALDREWFEEQEKKGQSGESPAD